MRNNDGLRTIAAKVPEALIRKLDRAARQGGRTRSSELRMRLERSLKELDKDIVGTPVAGAA